MLKTVAEWTSYIFEPFFTSALSFLLVLLKSDALLGSKFSWGLLALLCGAVPPLAVYFYEKKVGKIKDLFITNRVERRDVYLAWLVGSAVLAFLLWSFGVPRLILATTVSLLVISLLVTVTTLLWKISAHVVGVTFLVLVLLLVYSSSFLPLVLLIGLVAWARIYLGHHTLSQVTAASMITIIVVYSVFNLFDLATF